MESKPRYDGRLDKLESKLYSRAKSGAYRDQRPDLERPEIPLNEAWKHEANISDLVSSSQEEKELSQGKLFRNILWGSIAFFILALGVGAFIFFAGSNFVSANNIEISVSGPTSVSGGEELSLEVIVKNNNK